MAIEITGAGDSANRGAPRKFTRLDAIMLIAAAALMLSANRVAQWLWSWRDQGTTYGPGITRMMTWVLALIAPSLVLLSYHSTRSADRSRLCLGAPGLLVHLAVATVVLVQIAGWLAKAFSFLLLKGRPGLYSIRWPVEVFDFVLGDARNHIVVGVAASWLTLAILGRWSPERAWDDRLGRFIGCLWIIYYLCMPLLALTA